MMRVPHPGRRASVLAAACTAAVLAGPGPAGAQVAAQSFGGAIVGPPALGVADDGQAVLTWSGTTYIFTSVRPAGGRFGPARRLDSGTASPHDAALAVAAGGNALVAWHRRAVRSGRPAGPLLMSFLARTNRFAPARAVPGSDGAHDAAAALDPLGSRRLLAWRVSGGPGCGDVVVGALLRLDHRPVVHRISGPCPHASAVRAVLSADGTGAVVWRAGRTRTTHVLQAVAVGEKSFGTVRRLGRGTIAGDGAEVAAGASGALVVWRDRLPSPGEAVTGRVTAARVTASRVTLLPPVSTGVQVVGIPRVAGQQDGSALVTWQEGTPAPRVLSAALPAGAAAFTAPALVDGCGAADASRTYASPALAPDGTAAIAFQSGCMDRFGLGPDYGIVLARRTATSWPLQALSHGAGATGVRVGAANGGELVAAWVEAGSGGLRAAVLPAAP